MPGRTGIISGIFQPTISPTVTRSEWGLPFNLDGENSGPVREFIAGNAAYWIEEFHFDGFRVDATQSIFDSSAEHILGSHRPARAGSGTAGGGCS